LRIFCHTGAALHKEPWPQGAADLMSAMTSEQEKIAYLEEHISYEVVMLNYTLMRLLTSRPSTAEQQLDFNAYLESFAVHAGNLVAFLSNKSSGVDRNASDYLPDFEAPANARLQRMLIRLDKQVLHVTALGATDPQEKFTVDDARELYAWIVPAILRFQGQLGPLYRASLNARGAIEALASGGTRKAD
jgi:hypothetical protein